MSLYSVKNEALGARGVGEILIEAGATVEIELTDDEALLLGDLGGVAVSPVAEVKPAKAKPALAKD